MNPVPAVACFDCRLHSPSVKSINGIVDSDSRMLPSSKERGYGDLWMRVWSVFARVCLRLPILAGQGGNESNCSWYIKRIVAARVWKKKNEGLD